MSTDLQPVLEDADLNETDRKILAMIAEGRVSPPYVSEELEISREYASERLIRLKEHEHVERISPGLYELVDDPREDAAEVATEDEIELKQNLEAVKSENDDLQDELDQAQSRIHELEDDQRQDMVEQDRLRSALDEIEAAAERGNASELQDALRRAREATE